MANVVVLEDERIVRNLVTLVLRQHRHSVWQASSPENADRICDEHAVDFLVADIKLSDGKSGTDFALHLVQASPQIRCVFISGLPFEGWSEKDEANIARMPDHSYAILCKPLSPESLVKAIDDLLPPVKSQRIQRSVPACTVDPWMNTMRKLLADVQNWSAEGLDSEESWNLYTATAHVCLEEMKAVAATGPDSQDDLSVCLGLVIPHVNACYLALKSRDRAAACQSVTDALSILVDE